MCLPVHNNLNHSGRGTFALADELMCTLCGIHSRAPAGRASLRGGPESAKGGVTFVLLQAVICEAMPISDAGALQRAPDRNTRECTTLAHLHREGNSRTIQPTRRRNSVRAQIAAVE